MQAQLSFTLRILFSVALLFGFRPSYSQNPFIVDVDGDRLEIKRQLIVHPGYNQITFYFPGQKIDTHRFRYRMYSVEKEWNYTDYPVARYTRFDPGSHLFQVQVIARDKIIRRYSITVIIKALVWEKWWFWPFVAIMFIVFACTSLYFLILYDWRQKMKVEGLRNEIAADLHDEVGANLSSITFLAAMISKRIPNPDTELGVLLERITKNSKDSSSLINDTIWALNPNNDSLEILTEKIRAVAAEFLSVNDVALDFENQLVQQKINLTIEQRRNVYLTFKEIINNIVKHARASKVETVIAIQDGELSISVKDNGIGFDQSNIHDGNGLKNYLHRSRNGQINVKVDSFPGSGTTVCILVKLKNHHN